MAGFEADISFTQDEDGLEMTCSVRTTDAGIFFSCLFTLLSLFTFCQLFVYFTETLTKFCEVHPKVWLVQGHTDCDNLPSEVQAQLIAVLNSPSK